LNPLKVVIINYPDNSTEEMDAVNNPENPDAGTRKIPFSKTLYIEKDDFMENPPKKFFRLSPGNEVRLRYAYIIKCEEVIKDSSGNILELRCSYDPETKSGSGNSDKKVKGTIHWVSAEHSVNAEVRLYDRLFNVENPDETQEGQTFTDHLNPDSLKVLKNCKIEPALSKAIKTEKIQFERLGYFCFDSKDSSISNIVFNRTVTLKDSWSKLQK
ncbi:MAG: glutamine--tRNA ligase, partial [Ignavibacteria bacterium]|nr:glutamine--tRNA ligase [Ignavibacteria bacterium]